MSSGLDSSGSRSSVNGPWGRSLRAVTANAKPRPPRASARRTPSSWFWPPSAYSTASPSADAVVTASATAIWRVALRSALALMRLLDATADEQQGRDPDEQRDQPFRDRADAAQREPARIIGVGQVAHVPDDGVDLMVGERVGPEHRHLARSGADRLGDLQGG